MSETPNPGFVMWTYTRTFTFERRQGLVRFKAGVKGLMSTLFLDGLDISYDFTAGSGSDAVRNHLHKVKLPDGRTLEVEGGYCSWTSVAIAVRLDEQLVHESHPGAKIALPDAARKMMSQTGAQGDPAIDMNRLSVNKVPIAVDIATGLLFYIVAKMTDLTTAALVGAAVGVALVIIQRFVKVDILGGLALFGIVMLLISAGLAWGFQDDDMVKMRTTIVGIISAAAFLIDGLFGGRWLGKGLSRYLAYTDVDIKRLPVALGLIGLLMAGLNWVVAKTVSTDAWLFYTTFLDFIVAMALFFVGLSWARHRLGAKGKAAQ